MSDDTTNGSTANGSQGTTTRQHRTCHAAYTSADSRVLLLGTHA